MESSDREVLYEFVSDEGNTYTVTTSMLKLSELFKVAIERHNRPGPVLHDIPEDIFEYVTDWLEIHEIHDERRANGPGYPRTICLQGLSEKTIQHIVCWMEHHEHDKEYQQLPEWVGFSEWDEKFIGSLDEATLSGMDEVADTFKMRKLSALVEFARDEFAENFQ